MANYSYGATALTGGTGGCLDAIDGAALADLDVAMVVTASAVYIYSLDVNSAAAESSPGIISPDNNAGDKRWILQGAYPLAHKDTHDPNDGSDPLDTAAAAEISAVVAAGGGTSHSLARADHVHAINHGITDNHIVTVDQADAASGEFAQFTANGITSLSESEFKAAANLEIGTDVLAQQTIGIANNNLLEVDGTPLDTEVAVFTAAGINGLSTAEMKSLLTYLQAGDAINMADALLSRPEIKDYSETPHTEASAAGTLTLNLEDGNVFLVTLTEAVTTFDISNWLASKVQSLTIILTQDGTARAVDWTDEGILWAGGTAPDITTISTKHIITIMSPDGGTTKYGFHAGSEMA